MLLLWHQGDWGCNSLQYLLNTGSDMDISPVRVGRFALSAGSLQRIYLSTRSGFATVFTGEDRSRITRLKRTDRPVKSFTNKIVSLAPPMLLQKRVGSSNGSSMDCEVRAEESGIRRRGLRGCVKALKPSAPV